MKEPELIEQLVLQLKRADQLEELCTIIIDASIHWTSKDEEHNPKLKTARTLAGYFLKELGGEE